MLNNPNTDTTNGRSQEGRSYEEVCKMVNEITGNVPCLDFEPESIESAKARFSKAIETTFDPIACLNGDMPPPSKNRTHVFDLEVGIRIIASLDDLATRTIIHVSGSYTGEGAECLRNLAQVTGRDVKEVARTILLGNMEEIAPHLKFTLLLITPVGAFHFLAEEK